MSVVGYKYKVYKQNANHVRKVEKLLGVASKVYNHALSVRVRYYKLFHKGLSLHRLQAHMAKVRKRMPEWKIINSQSVQQICERIDAGYQLFFQKDAKHPPQHKSWRKYKSVTFKSSGYTLNGNTLTINALNLCLRFHMSRPIDGKVQRVNLKRDKNGDFWLSVSVKKVDSPIKVKPKTGKTAGFDFGLKHFLTANDGTKIDSPLYLFKNLNEVRLRNRQLSRKVEHSHGWRKAKASLNKLHRHVANLRSDFQWKLADKLVSEYDVLCFETLKMSAMKKMWGRKISDMAFAEFLKILEYKCLITGKKFVKIDQWEATSKTCSVCGHKESTMPLKIRKWTCPDCGSIHDRDINAAVNILRVGTSTLGRGDVRLSAG